MFRNLYFWLKVKSKKEDGMEMLQVVLIAGIVLVLIVTLFFPAIRDFFNAIMDTVTTWFTNKGSEPFK